MGRKSRRKGKESQTIRNQDTCQISLDQLKYANVRTILITDRLLLPAYRDDHTEDNEQDLQLDFALRPYFVSTLCYFCSKFSDNFQFACDSCRMVTYCSAEHRQRDLPQHGQLCNVLTEICCKNNGLALAENLGADEFRRFRMDLIRIIENALGRRLDLCEREIVLYPRLCRICHASSRELKGCPECMMEFFCGCTQHQGNHADYCQQFKVFRSILTMQRMNGFNAPRIPDITFDGNLKMLGNFDELMKEMYASSSDYAKIDCASYAALSQIASPALTALYAIKSISEPLKNPVSIRDIDSIIIDGKTYLFNIDNNLQNRKTFVIHIIGAELHFECANLVVWEKLFLHLLPSIRCLRLEFSGPELEMPQDIARVLEHPKLCAKCRFNNRKIDIIFHCGKLYHDLEDHKPDLVCLFNPGLYRTTGFSNQVGFLFRYLLFYLMR